MYASITVISSWLHSKTKSAFTTIENVLATRNDPRVKVRLWIVLFSFCLIFVIIELLWRSIDMFAVRRVLLPRLAEEKDESKKVIFDSVLMGFAAYRISLYFVLMVSDGLGTLFLGIGTWSDQTLDILMSIVLFINSSRLMLGVLEMHGGREKFGNFEIAGRMYGRNGSTRNIFVMN